MSKFGIIRYCPDCGSKVKPEGYENDDYVYTKCPIHGFVGIEFWIDNEAVVKQE